MCALSGETEKQVSGWTVDTLKEYVERRFTDQDKAVQAALLAAKEAVLKAENATEKRFEATNEFRQQLSDQTNTFIPRNEYDAQHQALVDKVATLTDRMNQDKGGEISMAKIYAAIGAVGVVLGIIVMLANGIL